MSDDLQDIKERIYEEELIEFLLEELECEHIDEEQHGDLITAQLPAQFESDNWRSVQIRVNESLTGYVRTAGISGDLFAVVGYILYECSDFEEVKDNLFQIKAWVCNTLGWEEYLTGRDTTFEESHEKRDWNSWLRPIQKNRKQRERVTSLEHKENEVLDSKRVFNRYIDKPSWHFGMDGINARTQKEFGVMLDQESERVVYPMHNKDGELVGIKGRYIGSSERTMRQMKYLFLYRCDKSIMLYNLHRAMEYIEEEREVIVFESAKSVMLAWQWGIKNAVSIEGSELSPVQASLLKQLEVPIVFAFDEDVRFEEVQKKCRQIKTRRVYAVYDEKGFLEELDSPVDHGKDVWEELYHNHKLLISG